MRKSLFPALAICLLLTLSAPLGASAAWWNIKSWIRKRAPEPLPQQNVAAPAPVLEASPVKGGASATSSAPAVNNAELEQKLEVLMKENEELKKQISSYENKVNSCKLELKAKSSALAAAVKDYSDYKFKYSWDGRMMKFTSPTSRKLSMRAIQFGIKETPTSMSGFLNEKSIEEAYMMVGTDRYNLERSGTVFKYAGGAINIDNSTILIAIVRGASGDTYFTNLIKSEWVIWDDTSDKQVRID